MIYFTSNILFGSQSIIEYENRPFTDAEHMDSVIIHNINSIVEENDTMFVLGNFCFGNAQKIEHYRSQISCKNVHIILGNHDKKIRMYRSLHRLFSSISSLKTLKIGTKKITLSHFPMERWPGYYIGHWHLYGFFRKDFVDNMQRRMCVGVSVNKFYPISIDNICKVLGLQV